MKGAGSVSIEDLVKLYGGDVEQFKKLSAYWQYYRDSARWRDFHNSLLKRWYEYQRGSLESAYDQVERDERRLNGDEQSDDWNGFPRTS